MSWLARAARERPEATAIRAGTRRLDFAELAERAAGAAAAIASAGVAPGDRVAVRLPNRFDCAVAIHAVAWLGAVLVPVHRRWTAREAAGPLADVGARLLVAEPDDPVAGPGLPCPVLAADALEAGGTAIEPAPQPDARPHSILLTSGTTGRARPVPLTCGNHRASARASAGNLGVEPDDEWLCCLPLSHVGGLAILVRSVLDGTAVTLVDGFEPATVAAHLSSGRISLASLVPTMLRRLLDLPSPLASPRLRAVLVGGGPFDRATIEEALDRGIPALGTYGMTETASQVATVPPEAARRKAGSAGRPLPGVELQVIGTDGRCAGHAKGAIRVRGAMVSGASAGPDGWLATGDRGRLDEDGFLWVEGRRDDLVVTGGENVAPAEVEAVLRRHPAVAECAVTGVPDPDWGRAVAAAVVPRDPGRPPDAGELAAWCRARLAGFKVPRRWAVVAELPRTPSGKVAIGSVRRLFD